MNLISQIKKEVENKVSGGIIFEENLSKYSWFNLGGPAKVVFKPKNLNELSVFLKNVKGFNKIKVLGVGSNTLIRDGGYNGIIIKLGKSFSHLSLFDENTIIAGATIFETDVVAHTQYIASNEDRQAFGSLDFLFNYLINERYSDKSYFSFGTSNANNGKTLNKGLNYWKECFGARTVVHDTYSINTKNHKFITQSLL